MARDDARDARVVAFIRANRKKLTKAEIAREAKASFSYIKRLCDEYKLEPVASLQSRIFRRKVKIVTRYIEQGYSRYQIHCATGYSYTTVAAICKQHGIVQPRTDTELMLKYMRDNTDKSVAYMANRYSLTPGHIRRICRDNDIWLSNMNRTRRWHDRFKNS